jgi:hypothetical protein
MKDKSHHVAQEVHYIPAGPAGVPYSYGPNFPQAYIGPELIDDGEDIYLVESSLSHVNAGH